MKKNEIVYEKLKEMILDHRLDATNALNERELSVLFDSSRTPVREAINRLANQGLLTVIPGRGTFIRRVSVEDVIEIYNIKQALDCLAISLAMEKFSGDDINKLEIMLAEMEKLAVEESAEEFFKLDIAFHKIITERTGSARLMEMLERLDEQIVAFIISSVRSKERMDLSIKEHKILLTAINEKDIEKAQNSIRNHMESVKQFHINRIG